MLATQTDNPYQKYKQQSVMTMTQGEMLTQLFDAVIKQLNIAILAMESNDFSSVNHSLQKSQMIINHLRQTLNHNYKISKNLDILYEYFNHRIIQANTKKDTNPLLEIIPMLTELRETFVQADRTSRTN